MTTATKTNMDREFARMFFGERQVDVTHFFAINWTEDAEVPIRRPSDTGHTTVFSSRGP